MEVVCYEKLLITLINKKDSSLPIDAIEISKIQSNHFDQNQ